MFAWELNWQDNEVNDIGLSLCDITIIARFSKILYRQVDIYEGHYMLIDTTKHKEQIKLRYLNMHSAVKVWSI